MQITTIAVDSCVDNVVQINGNCTSSPWLFKKVHNAAHWISHFRVEKALSFSNTYLVDSDLSGELCYPTFDELGLVIINLLQLTCEEKSDEYPIIRYYSYYWLIHIDPCPKIYRQEVGKCIIDGSDIHREQVSLFSIMRFIVSETF